MMGYDERISSLERNLRRLRRRELAVLAVFAVGLLGAAARDPFVDLVCATLLVKSEAGQTTTALLQNGDVEVGGELHVQGRIIADQIIPVGGVILWWGDPKQLPAGFELCDGGTPTTPDATLQGTKPELRDRFPKGAPPTRQTRDQLATGGSNHLPAHHHGIGTLAIQSAGEHAHSMPTTDDDHGGRGDSRPTGVADGEMDYPQESLVTDAAGAHAHGLAGLIGSVEGVDGDGGDQAGANQPAYTELFMIIRVK